MALTGRNSIVLKRENRPDRRAVYSEAYMPVVRDGQVLGVVEIYVVFGAADASNARTRRGCAIWRTTMYSAAH